MRTLEELERDMSKNHEEGEEILKKYVSSPSRELRRSYTKSIKEYSSLVREYIQTLSEMRGV